MSAFMKGQSAITKVSEDHNEEDCDYLRALKYMSIYSFFMVFIITVNAGSPAHNSPFVETTDVKCTLTE